jgi:peptide subunit release factor 1 (eRF1)
LHVSGFEARHNYVRKVCEYATAFFITNGMPNVAGLVIGGSADLKVCGFDDIDLSYPFLIQMRRAG